MLEKPFRPPLLKQVGNLQQSSSDHPATESPTKKRRLDVDNQPVDLVHISSLSPAARLPSFSQTFKAPIQKNRGSDEKSNVNPDTRDEEAYYNVLW